MTLAPWPEEEIRSFASIGTGAKDTKDRVTSGKYPFFVRSQKVERINSWSFDGEAVLTAGDGVGTGKVFHYIDGKFDYHQRVYRISDFRSDVSGRYFFHQFSRNFLARIESLTAKSSVDSVRMETIAGMRIPLPERAEQDRIVQAVDDVDDLIATLERLIAKKQAIKQGMMQQLLSGRARLPGFASPWSELSLGNVARIKTGFRNNQDKQAGGKYPFFVRSATVERIDSYSYDCEAILVPGEGGIGSIFHYINGKFEVHQRVYKISDFAPNASGRFIYYFMRQYFGVHAMENSVKATVDSLRLPTFKNFQLRLPSRDEQDAIVCFLDDAEAEVATLKSRLAKARAIKAGMMQQLLTGRTRLPLEAVS
ncbi:restriction endonuclease subunit S [Gordonia alkaliphila]|uniref:restriction endonuclease subunit S n=1 Tax=Gordonia alkaliphila TaxID=1053547 RepID=UPI001FF67D36|nr:restriction endonuclease subunit S [Gordonia alkaliphila]MCK0439051.1 restriction endonuclease subunit S [Gordonia alkaliphila]